MSVHESKSGCRFLEGFWADLGEDPRTLSRVASGGHPAFRSYLPAGFMARDAVAAASLAAALIADRHIPSADGKPRTVELHSSRLTTAIASERHFRLNGNKPDIWAAYSGFWRAADGWVRTHANYPHHQSRLLSAIGLSSAADLDTFGRRISELQARELEDRVSSAGGIAVAVRTVEEWAREPAAAALKSQPMVGKTAMDCVAVPSPMAAKDPAAPLVGLRVLDLTRVIAGPVATRTLALLGAEVLRVDAPGSVEAEWQHLDTGPGKRTTVLDLRRTADRRTFEDLLSEAHVVVTGYRPGALGNLGLDPEDLTARRSGLVIGRLSAWGYEGPWAHRRGFDSIVQAATGIAMLESPGDNRPGALPAQVLDHSAGYLLAAGILSAVREQLSAGDSWLVETSLATLAAGLVGADDNSLAVIVDDSVTTCTEESQSGALTYARPAINYEDGPERWPAPSRPWGKDPAKWATTPAVS